MAPAASASDLYTEFRRTFDERQYAAAAELARKLLELADQQAKSPLDEEVQVALMNLALAQYYAGDYTGAETSYLRVIDAAEKSGRPLTTRLARANAGLAGVYYANKRYDVAVERFDKAVAMSRRDEGLLNTQQVPMLEKYADALTRLGRYQDALQAHKYILRVETRTYGESDPRIAPALERFGRWYARVGAYDQSRRTLKQALEVVVRSEGEASSNLIGPLAALAECDRLQLFDPTQVTITSTDTERSTMFHDEAFAPPTVSPGVLAAEGEKALQRAVALAEARKEPSFVQIADVRTQLGDWYQVFGQPERALPQYVQAWHAAKKVTAQAAGKPLTTLLFGEPALLHFVRPEGWDRYAKRKPDEMEVRSVSTLFTVDAEGRPQGIKVTDDSGDAKRAQKTVQALKDARYRPRFDNGKPVPTPDMVFTQPWMLLLEPQPTEGEPGKPNDGKASG